MLKVKSKSEIFRQAWQIARDAALRWGGSARSYIAAALRTVYSDLRRTACRALDRVAKQVAVNTGVYAAMTTLNTPSTIVDQAIATVSSVASTAVAKISAIANKTLGFFRKVFTSNLDQEVALE